MAALVGALLACGAARAQTTLSLPIPERESLPREKVSLTIKLPEKIEKVEAPPTVKPKLRSPVFDSYRFSATQPIPRKRFVYNTLRNLRKLGIRPDSNSAVSLTRARINDYDMVQRAVWMYYEKLLDIYRKDALPRFTIQPIDLERFRQVMDIFGPAFQHEFRNTLEADRLLVKMIEQLQEIRGEGTIKLVELKEATDGSMVLEIEVRKKGALR
jgi:hypothetical protein